MDSDKEDQSTLTQDLGALKELILDSRDAESDLASDGVDPNYLRRAPAIEGPATSEPQGEHAAWY